MIWRISQIQAFGGFPSATCKLGPFRSNRSIARIRIDRLHNFVSMLINWIGNRHFNVIVVNDKGWYRRFWYRLLQKFFNVCFENFFWVIVNFFLHFQKFKGKRCIMLVIVVIQIVYNRKIFKNNIIGHHDVQPRHPHNRFFHFIGGFVWWHVLIVKLWKSWPTGKCRRNEDDRVNVSFNPTFCGVIWDKNWNKAGALAKWN